MLDFYRIPHAPEKLTILRSREVFDTSKVMSQTKLPSESSGEVSSGEQGPSRNKEEAKHFLDKLVRLIPGESIGLYIFAQNLIGDSRPITLVVWSAFCLFIAGLSRYVGSKNKQGKPQWGAVIIASISFVIWLYNMGGPFLIIPSIHDPIIASLIIAGWTTLTAYFYEPSRAMANN